MLKIKMRSKVGVTEEKMAMYQRPSSRRSSYKEDDGSSDDEDLQQAIKGGKVERVEKLLNTKTVVNSIDELDSSGLTALHYAAKFDRFECGQLLILKGHANCSIQNREGIAPLHLSAKRKEMKKSKGRKRCGLIELLSTMSNINIKDNLGSTALHFAAMRGNGDVCFSLLECGASINMVDISGTTALHVTATYNQPSVASLLLKKGANYATIDKCGNTALHKACMRPDTSNLIQIIIQSIPTDAKLAYLNQQNNDQESALHLAINACNVLGVQHLLDAGADISARSQAQISNSLPLHLAAISGNVEIIKILIQRGAKTCSYDLNRNTPLQKAVEYQNEDAVQILLDNIKSYEINLKDQRQFSALLFASCYPNTTIVKKLLNAGADLMATEYRDKNAFHLASDNDQTQTLKVLLEYGKKLALLYLVNEIDYEGETPIHDAARNDNVESFKLLLENKCDLSTKNEHEETPFLIAVKCDRKKIVDLILEETKYVLNEHDEVSNTGLHIAAQEGHVEIVQTLLQAGANKVCRNDRDEAPLDLAAKNNREYVIPLFLQEGISPDSSGLTKMPPLLLAAKYGCPEATIVLINQGADILIKDEAGRNCLDLAIEAGHREVCKVIVECDQWQLTLLNETFENGHRTTPMRKLIRKMPDIAQIVLNRCVTQSKSSSKTDEDHWYYLNFLFLEDTYFDYKKDVSKHVIKDGGKPENTVKNKRSYPYTTDMSLFKENHPLMIMVEEKQDDLLAHPVVLALVRHKWNIVRPMYLLFMLFYILYVSLFTVYMMTATPEYKVDSKCNVIAGFAPLSNVPKHLEYFVLIFAICGMILEITQFISCRWVYLQALNILDWFTYISVVVVVIDVHECNVKANYQWQLGAVSLFFLWINLLLLMRRLPILGMYIVMMTEILATFLKFFVAFFLFIVAFALAFHVLLQNQSAFSTPFYAILKTWVMMIGEFDFNSIFHEEDETGFYLPYEKITYLIFIIFLIVMSIVLMNLLVGLAVDDVGGLQSQSKLRKIACQIELGLDMELGLPHSTREKLKFDVTGKLLYPNKDKRSNFRSVAENLYDGAMLTRDKIMQGAAAIDGERLGQVEELEQLVNKSMVTNKVKLAGLEEKLNNVENMMQMIINKSS